jgi:hypothetical protein
MLNRIPGFLQSEVGILRRFQDNPLQLYLAGNNLRQPSRR